ncbi:HAMP domain-containing histidine kinase [Mucilaginibacter sp. S1162]|uniref:histidine kinase n=1 Tax=Mucilaginibacter humi TaxID=2732510 RepID=A0ABX1W2D8_9SPHI|nr:HAMP domain-containing histidine kinase [Mucilaginibacter humi]
MNQLKSSFITPASHEFRTPLSSVLLSATLIERYRNAMKKSRWLNMLQKSNRLCITSKGCWRIFFHLKNWKKV